MPSSHLILCHPLLLLPPIPPSIRVFSNESTVRMRWPKYWSFSFSISPSNEHPGLISFRMDWLDLLAVRGTLKSLLQHHSSKASIFQRSAYHYLISEHFPHLKKKLCTYQQSLSIPSSPPFLAITNILSISVDLPVLDILNKQNCTICSLYYQLLSFGIISSRFIHIAAYIVISFLSMTQ